MLSTGTGYANTVGLATPSTETERVGRGAGLASQTANTLTGETHSKGTSGMWIRAILGVSGFHIFQVTGSLQACPCEESHVVLGLLAIYCLNIVPYCPSMYVSLVD
jgi:hypothetical protein